MTATSPPPTKRRLTLPTMELLGFIDHPTEAHTPPPQATPRSATTLPRTEMVTRGRHVAPSGDLVQDIWDTTELKADSLLDWQPEGMATRKLSGRNIRWPVVAFVIALTASVVGGAYWAYNRPVMEADAAAAEVRSLSTDLSAALEEITPLVESLGSDTLPEAAQDSSAYSQLGEKARALFTASAELPQDASGMRTGAGAAVGLTLDITGSMMDATAYRMALEPVLGPPGLETDPELIDLAVAADDFIRWRSGLEAVLSALPDQVATGTSRELAAIVAELDQVQDGYLEALRLEDQSGAGDVLMELGVDLEAVRQTLLTELEATGDRVLGLVGEARDALGDLLG